MRRFNINVSLSEIVDIFRVENILCLLYDTYKYKQVKNNLK